MVVLQRERRHLLPNVSQNLKHKIFTYDDSEKMPLYAIEEQFNPYLSNPDGSELAQ